jgi:hypothetical protein
MELLGYNTYSNYLWKFAHINKVYIINGEACFVLYLKIWGFFVLDKGELFYELYTLKYCN